MLRGWLSEEQTAELLAMQEEDDASLHGVILAAGALAVSRVLQSPYGDSKVGNGGGGGGGERPPDQTMNLRVTNEANLRLYCGSGGGNRQHGCLTTYFEADHSVPPVADRADFWRYAHEMTVRHNASKGSREPLKMLRVYSKMLSLGGSGGGTEFLRDISIRNDMGVAVYGDMGALFRR